MTHHTIHHLVALRVLRRDAERLTPAAARMAATYLPIVTLDDDLWRSAINETLQRRAADVQGLPFDVLVSTFGRPGAWLRAGHRDDDAIGARMYLAAIKALAELHAPRAPTAA